MLDCTVSLALHCRWMMRTHLFINVLSLSGTLEKRLVDKNKRNLTIQWGSHIAWTSPRSLPTLPQTPLLIG